MRAVVQRVIKCSVEIGGEVVSSCQKGLLVLVGIEESDCREDIEWLSHKICGLRVFDDGDGVMNRSVTDIRGDIIAVSQFTLHARIKKGSRPSYIDAASPEVAIPLYESFVEQLEKELGRSVGTGVFGASMRIQLTNDGPVTIFIDTKNKK